MLIGSQLGNKIGGHTRHKPMLGVVGYTRRVTMTPMLKNFVLQAVRPRSQHARLEQIAKAGLHHGRGLYGRGRETGFFGQLTHRSMQWQLIRKIKAPSHRLPITGFVCPFNQ